MYAGTRFLHRNSNHFICLFSLVVTIEQVAVDQTEHNEPKGIKYGMLNLVTRQDVAVARDEQPDVPTVFFINIIKHKNTISS